MKKFIFKRKTKILILICALTLIVGSLLFIFIKNYDQDSTKKEVNKVTFPYTDNEGKIRYKLVINGTEIKTKNYPFKLTEEEIGSYYPIKDILKYFNIETLSNDDNTILTTKINGDIIRVDADQGKMKYGNTTMEALDGNIKTILVDDVLYVPSFFFMSLTGNSIVDYSNDNTSATLNTDLVVNSSNSGISGLSIIETNSNGNKVAGNGYHICSACGGAGGSNTAYFEQNMVNGRQVLTTKYRWQTCPVCGGTGHVH